jgi:hypothetical protein
MSTQDSQKLVGLHAFITSKLDYGNCLITGIFFQNAAARVQQQLVQKAGARDTYFLTHYTNSKTVTLAPCMSEN